MTDWFLFPENTPPTGFVLVTRKGRENRTVDILWHQNGTFTRQPAYGQSTLISMGGNPYPNPLMKRPRKGNDLTDNKKPPKGANPSGVILYLVFKT